MEDDKLFSDLSSDDSQLVEKALLTLQDKLAQNKGVLVMRDLSKLRTAFLKVFEHKDKFKESKVFLKVFEFLSSFLTNNYGSDYEIQFTSHILFEVIKYLIEVNDNTIELADEALETYIRSFKQLENVIDLLLLKFLTSDNEDYILKGIKLAIKNIEYHPKIISASSKSFINFIETLCSLSKDSNKEIAKEAKSVVISFIKRFPATIKEISNIMESRDVMDLANLIKESNDSIQNK